MKTTAIPTRRASDGSCWGLLLLTSPQNSLTDPPKQEADPPILDIWLSQPCRPEGDKNDQSTALLAYVLATLLPVQIREWSRAAGGMMGGEINRAAVFGYAIPKDIITAMNRLNEEKSLGIEVEYEHAGRAFLLAARHVWPQPVAPWLETSRSLSMTKVQKEDVEAVWEGANKYYSQVYIASRSHLSCCLRERLTEVDTEKAKLSNPTRPIAWALAHSALSIAATFVIPDWRGIAIKQGEETDTAHQIAPPTRASHLIIRSISREVVQAKLFALWACGLSSTPDTWAPTNEASAEIPDPFVTPGSGTPALVPSWHDLLSVCAESEDGNLAAFRMWERLGFDSMDEVGPFEVSWIKFSIPLPRVIEGTA
ncbi:unnamed protein product [Tilletia controversa]|nr:hypothetical protein CF328_g8847 [Tilletia controversa]CAD6966853.1 unnamed protein product [Tilletia controversa]